MDAERYSRQALIPELGPEGQRKICQSSVLIVGLGGLGSPVALYLTAAGVGTIGLAERDTVSLSNLQRQILYSENDLGKEKVLCAHRRLSAMSSHTVFHEYPWGLTSENALQIISQYDLVVDCTDNLETRRLLDQACLGAGKPWVHGAIEGFYGHVTVFNHTSGRRYSDLFPEDNSSSGAKNSEEDEKDKIIGTFGVLPGIVGCLQTSEALKLITGIGEILDGRLLTINLLDNSIQTFDF